jgi:hypothetical protein
MPILGDDWRFSRAVRLLLDCLHALRYLPTWLGLLSKLLFFPPPRSVSIWRAEYSGFPFSGAPLLHGSQNHSAFIRRGFAGGFYFVIAMISHDKRSPK